MEMSSQEHLYTLNYSLWQVGSLPLHCPVALQILSALPASWNPGLHLYLAKLLNVVLLLIRETVPSGMDVGEPQSTTANEREGGSKLVKPQMSGNRTKGRLVPYFHKLVHSHSTFHQPGMFSQLVHSKCSHCHTHMLLYPQRRCHH